MNVKLSPSQVGYIVKTIEKDIKDNADVLNLSLDLCQSVKEHFECLPMGKELYDEWYKEWFE